MRRFLCALALTLLVAAPAAAQYLGAPGTNVQQQPPISVVSGANASVTATLPAAGAGLFHYIYYLELTHSCTAGVAGSANLTITTTNLNGLSWLNGNLCNAGQEHQTFMPFNPPLKSQAANTATTIVFPAMGTAAISSINVYYFTGP